MEPLRIGLVGWGTVGSALGALVESGPLPMRLAWVAVREPGRERGVALPEGVPVAGEPGPLDEIDALVELAGSVPQPRGWAEAALSAGLPYVTANKALLAAHGGELAELAAQRGAALLASASVGGGTPMLEVTEHLAAAGRIRRLRGLLNATTTSILAAMGDGRSYDEALSTAQEAGIAEADPSLDVDGRDAAQKLAILAWVAWGRWRAERDVRRSGIVGLTVSPGAVVRLVADGTPDELTVAPVALDADSPLGAPRGIECLLEIEVDGAETVTIRGPGAGGPVSAGAVYADLARLARGERPILGRQPHA
ncbi:MAG TPA: homoserine dehydrogenase, partial [Methylomirabilota bacterium]|nr:homoserine dehydrogenase [Methylomirabilota bacterium]